MRPTCSTNNINDHQLNAIKRFFGDIEVNPPTTLEEQLTLLSSAIVHAVCIDGGDGTGKTTLLADLENHLKQRGHGVIRGECRKNYSFPFEVARTIIKQAQALYPDKAAGLEEKYYDILSAFRHQLHSLSRQSQSGLVAKSSGYLIRIDQAILNERTIGLIRQIINYLLELVTSTDKLTIILLDDFQFADFWSISFLAHLVRRLKRLPISIGIACDPKVGSKSRLIKGLLKKADFCRIKLTPTDMNSAECHNALSARLQLLNQDQRLILNYLCVLDDPIGLADLHLLINGETYSSNLLEILDVLCDRQIIVRGDLHHQIRYAVSQPLWKEFVYHSIPLVRRRQYHFNVAKLHESGLLASSKWNWEISDKINRMYFHFVKSGDWLAALGYSRAYYSCAMNTYLDHVEANLRELNALITTETNLGKGVKQKVMYQLASGTNKRVGSVKRRIKDCERYLRVETDPYYRAESYANISVLYSHLKTEEAYKKALEFAEIAYQECSKVKDVNLHKNMVACVNNAKALTYYRQKGYGSAIELEEEALRLLEEADKLRARAALFKETVLFNLATVYSKSLKDYTAAHNHYRALLSLARERKNVYSQADFLRYVAENSYRAGRYQEALQYFLECIQIAGGNYKLVTTCTSAYKSVGLCYRQLCDDQNSTRYFLEALALAVEIADLAEIADLLANIGLNFYKQGKYDQACYYYFQALRVRKHAKLKQAVAKSYADLGVLFIKKNDYAQAARFFKEAGKTYAELNNLDGALKCYSATISCHNKNRVPCNRKAIKEIGHFIQLITNSCNKDLCENFVKVYLNQVPILLGSGRAKDAEEMLVYYDEFTKGINLDNTLVQG